MDLPERSSTKPTITLRRHSTSPSAAGRAVIASVSGSVGTPFKRSQASLSYRSMKSNPYVGWFRHSPPTTAAPRVRISCRTPTTTTTRKDNPWCTIPTSLVDCKNSPHIGWFRHAPPSRLDTATLHASRTNTMNPVLSSEDEDLLWKLLQKLNPALEGIMHSRDSMMVSGYLRGGGKDYMEKTRSRRALVRDLQESSAEGTMSTVNALSRLASWFLFPLAHDAESCGYRQEHYSSSRRGRGNNNNKNRKSDKDDNVLSQFLSPYLPSFLEEPPLTVSHEGYAKYGARLDDDTDSEGGGDDDSYSSSDSESTIASREETSYNQSKTSMGRSKDLSLSVSSLAEAYYAHQTTTKELTERVHPSPSFAGGGTAVSPHRLDYVITQMDIARMTRNASRHLDVQSILSLPVITYQKGARGSSATSAKPRVDSWSWTIVEESEGGQQGASAAAAQGEEEDFCVICLEHFEDGDRLRVLPCDHSFHVGCIDRWLSGSQSFEECYTSGCPTCKKRPTLGSKPRAQSFCEPISSEQEGKHRSSSLDGSVPSWAFAQIGSALVAQDQGISICSGASDSS